MDCKSTTQLFLTTSAALQSFLNDYTSLSEKSPRTVYVNLDGIRLGRSGSISIISLFVPSLGTVYHIDSVTLGNAVVTTKSASGISLKAILECPTAKKVFFDVRNDSDALFAHYQISLRGVIDIQLLELATRSYSRRYVASLAKCIDGDSAVTPAMKEQWRAVGQTFDLLRRSEHLSGRCILDSRPVDPCVLEFCKLRVILLPDLWRVYSDKLRPPGETFWRWQITTETDERVMLAKSARYDGESRDKVLGPSRWDPEGISDATFDWNEDLMFAVTNGDDLDGSDYGDVLLGKNERHVLLRCSGGF